MPLSIVVDLIGNRIISRGQDTHDKRRLPVEENMVSPQNRPMCLERPQHTSTRTKFPPVSAQGEIKNASNHLMKTKGPSQSKQTATRRTTGKALQSSMKIEPPKVPTKSDKENWCLLHHTNHRSMKSELIPPPGVIDTTITKCPFALQEPGRNKTVGRARYTQIGHDPSCRIVLQNIHANPGGPKSG